MRGGGSLYELVKLKDLTLFIYKEKNYCRTGYRNGSMYISKGNAMVNFIKEVKTFSPIEYDHIMQEL